jgi:hypothetical protein
VEVVQLVCLPGGRFSPPQLDPFMAMRCQ